MPYSSNAELPASVKEKLSTPQQSQWRAVFNRVHAKTGDEGQAMRMAWGAVKKSDEWSATVDIAKVDADQQLVFGWLSVAVDKAGEKIVDADEDIIEEAELEKAAYDHVLYFRQAGEMHERIGVGRLVESMVFTVEKQKALGIPQGTLPVGWWVGYRIDDANTWSKIKSGEYKAWSVGGHAKREEV
jgi:cation transport regulator ChaB